MAKETAKAQEAHEKPAYARKKLTAQYVDLKDLGEKGEVFLGRFLGKQTGPWIDKQTGEEKTLTRLIFERIDAKTLANLGRVVVFEDAGLRKSMEDSMVKEGDVNEYLHLGKTSIGGGRSVNQYDIFSVDSPQLKSRPVAVATPVEAATH